MGREVVEPDTRDTWRPAPPPPRPRPPWRRIAAWCATPLLLAASVPVVCRAAGVDGITPVPQMLAFLPWLAVPAGLGLLLAVAARRPAVCAWALAVLATTGWYARPYGGDAPQPRGPVVAQFRVLTANLEYGGATGGLLRALRQEEPDVVSVQECDERCGAALDSEAVRTAYPYRNVVAGLGAEGSALLSRYPLRPERGVDATLTMPGAVADIGGRDVRLLAAHPMPPVPGQVDLWRTELGLLRDYAERSLGGGGRPLLIAGDFNATQDHAAFRRLLGTGLRDSARSAGQGSTPSWPARTAPTAGAQIDHVLVSDAFQPRAARFLDLADTDHRALLVDLDLHAR